MHLKGKMVVSTDYKKGPRYRFEGNAEMALKVMEHSGNIIEFRIIDSQLYYSVRNPSQFFIQKK